MFACRVEATMLSKTLSVFLAVLFVADFSHGQTNQPQFRADYTYIETFGSYYKFHSTPKTWLDAKRTCSEEGASLFYPDTADEAKAVISFWNRAKSNAPPGTTYTWQSDWMFVGISDIVTEGVFETIDGKSIYGVYNNWNPRQPDNANNVEDCVHMHREGGLNDIPCDNAFSFVCKKRTDSCTTLQSNFDGQINQPQFRADYTYIESFGSYYKFHSTPKTWLDAKRTCSEEGASLFYPDTADEAKAVISFWNRAKSNALPGTTYTWQSDWMFVGISDIVTEGVFETIDGKSIYGVYNKWNSRQPDNANNVEDCVHMHREGGLNDILCDNAFSFICKKRTDRCTTLQSKFDVGKHKNFSQTDYSYIQAVDSYYKIHTTRRTFADAKQTCALEGASLFYPEDKVEAEAVLAYWNRVQPSTDEAVLLGLTDMETEGTFKTINGRPISDVYTHWRAGEPNNHGPHDEDCVLLYRQGNMNDVSCFGKFPYICKKKDYTYIQAVDSYYKIHTSRRTFADAKQTCALEGASLFYPEDKVEAEAVLAYWNRVQPSTDEAVLLGLTDMETEGKFKTINGRPISDVYTHWRAGEPNNHGPHDEDCVLLYRQGNMNDVSCFGKFPYICKKKDYTYIQAVDSYYKIHTSRRTFADAKQTCALEGASLFYPEDKVEAEAVLAYWNRVQPSTDEAVLLGLTDMETEGKFKTINGRPISDVYTHWRAGEPNNHGPHDEDCVLLYRQGDMNDVSCFEKFPYICKKKDYTYIQAVDSYYKIHTTRRTFADAKQTCALEGASLFYPEDKVEAEAVLAYWNRVQPSTDEAVLLGLTDMETEGTFKTINGRQISDVYTHWRAGEPNNHGPHDEDCVLLYRQGDMNDVSCFEKFPCICKKKDYTYIQAVDSYYKIHTTGRTFADAKHTCLLEGASLFYPEDKVEADAVLAYWKRVEPSSDKPVLLGLTDMETEGVFKTIDGRAISEVYTNWRSGQPDDHGALADEDCVFLYKEGDMNDVRCGNKFRFICKRRMPQKRKEHSNMANLDYTFSGNIGNFYKLHRIAKSWSEAADVCRAEQSHLVVINNALEANFIVNVTKSVAKQANLNKIYRSIIHVGIHYTAEKGWHTITGQEISDVSGWWGKFPPTAHGTKKCGSMWYTGILQNISCNNKKSFFICEHEVDDAFGQR